MVPSALLWLRRTRRALAAASLLVALVLVAMLGAFRAAAGTPEEAAGFARSLEPLARTFTPLFGRPEALDTPGGFLTWRGLSVMPLIVSIYAILLATRMTAGEERRGATDLVLSTPVPRSRVLLGQGLALLVSSTALGLGGMLIAWAAAQAFGIVLPFTGAVGAGLGVTLVVLLWGAVAGLLAQLVRSRAAAGAGSGLLMVLAFLLSNLSLLNPTLESVDWLSPFSAYQASRPLVPGRQVDPGALLVLALLAVVVWGLALLVNRARDLNVSAPRSPLAFADASPLLRGPLVRDTWSLKGVALAWGAGLTGALSLLLVLERSLRGPLEEFIENAGALGELFAGQMLGDAPLAALMFGGFLGPILSVFAILQAGRWAGELEEGFFDLALSTPVSRLRLLVSRVAAALLSAGLALALAWLIAMLVAAARGVPLDAWALAWGMGISLVSVLIFLSLGLLAGTWFASSWAVPAAAGVAVLNFVFDLLSPLLDLPAWSRELSLFARLGNPVQEGVTWTRHGLLVLVGLALLAGAALGWQRKDLTD